MAVAMPETAASSPTLSAHQLLQYIASATDWRHLRVGALRASSGHAPRGRADALPRLAVLRLSKCIFCRIKRLSLSAEC